MGWEDLPAQNQPFHARIDDVEGQENPGPLLYRY
jgi:hypothetical protein